MVPYPNVVHAVSQVISSLYSKDIAIFCIPEPQLVSLTLLATDVGGLKLGIHDL